MKKTPILAVSMLALMISGAAIAADNNTDKEISKDYYAKPEGAPLTTPEADDTKPTRELKKGLNKADTEMRQAADKVKAFFMDGNGDGKAATEISYHEEFTVKGLLGKKITTPGGENIAKIHDVILDAKGGPSKIIVSDGGMLGIGDKLAAFDYSRVISSTEDNKIAMNLSQDMIDRAKEFSYDAKDAAKASVLPADGISANDLIDGEVYDANGKKVATVENITLVDGEASKVLVGYGKTLGLGGHYAALDFGSLSFVKNKGDTDVKMSTALSTQFADFRKTASK